MTRIEKRNTKYINLLLILLSSRVFMEFLNVLLNGVLKLSSTSFLTIGIYSILFVIFFFYYVLNQSSSFKDLIWILAIYIFYLISFSFSKVKENFFGVGMVLLYLFYIPISFGIVANISSWNEYEKITKKYVAIDLIAALFTMVLSFKFGSSDSTTYMTVTYAILPILCSSFLILKTKMDIPLLLLSLANLVLMVLYGARMGLFLAIIMLVLCFFQKVGKVGKFFLTLLLVCVIFFCSGLLQNASIIKQLTSFASDKNIHILNQLLKGELFSSSGREEIYEEMRYQINNMGSNVYGLFGDRLFTTSYAHNIFYETILSFGWFGGIFFLFLLLVLSTIGFHSAIKQKRGMLFICFFLSFFCKFFVSSSFAIDYSFFIYVAIALSFAKSNKKAQFSISNYENFVCHC